MVKYINAPLDSALATKDRMQSANINIDHWDRDILHSAKYGFGDHRYDGCISSDEEHNKLIKIGYFKDLLKFRMNVGNKILKNHLPTARHNNTFISKITKNEIMECCREIVQIEIVEKVKIYKFYSMLVDEITTLAFSNSFHLRSEYGPRKLQC
jgi:hypothetical protein